MRPVWYVSIKMRDSSAFSDKYPTNREICYRFLDMSADLSVKAATFTHLNVSLRKINRPENIPAINKRATETGLMELKAVHTNIFFWKV